MAANISVDLVDGSDVTVPFTITGSASAISPATSVTSVQVQMDQGMITPRPDTSGPGDSYDFSLEVTESLCPVLDQGYTLTIYAWDNTTDLTTLTVGFRRIG